MTDETLKQSILQDLETGSIKQHARWFFVVKEYGLWLIAGLTVLLGSFALAIILAALEDLPSTLYAMQQSGAAGVAVLLPYLWMFGVLAFLALAYNRVRTTNSGYRYPVWALGVGIVFASVIGGSVVFASGFAHSADQYFAERVPAYTKYGNPQHAVWRNPQQGRLAGKIIQTGTSTYTIKDIRGEVWLVDMSQVEGGATLSEHTFVRFTGERVATGTFKAAAIYTGPEGKPQRPGYIKSERKIKHMRSTR